MVVVVAHITVIAGCEAAFERAAAQLAAASLEHEPGLRRYEYVRLAERAQYQATLAFEDYDAFIEHQASSHHHVIAGAMRELIAELRLERVDPVAGCSALARTPSPEYRAVPDASGPIDEAAVRARRDHYRLRYPMHRAAWWGELG
jgi:quinol monooxygenase YgiN